MIILLAAVGGAILGAVGLYLVLRKLGRKRTMKTLDIVLVVVYLTFIAFCATMIVMYWKIGSIPETFSVAVIGSFIGEYGCTTRITNTKNRREEHQWEVEQRKEEAKNRGCN